MAKTTIIRIIAIIVFIVTIAFGVIFSCTDTKVPDEKPYVYHNILYLELKEIPLQDIVKIEFIRDPVVYVMIHYKKGIYSLPLSDYLKVREKLWYWELFQ